MRISKYRLMANPSCDTSVSNRPVADLWYCKEPLSELINVCNSGFALTVSIGHKLWCRTVVSEIFRCPGFECGIGKRPNSPTWVCCYLDRLKWRWLDQVPSLPTTKLFKLLQYNTDPVHHNDWGWKCPLEEEVSHPCLSHNSDTVLWECSVVERGTSAYLSICQMRSTTTAPGNLATAFSQYHVVTLKFQNLTFIIGLNSVAMQCRV